MNSFELNKILGAVLGTCLALLAVHIASGAIFTPAVPAKPGYEIAVKEEQPPQGTAAKPAEVPIETMLASASVPQGTGDAKVCLTCHNFEKGQGAKIGPDLYGVVGRPVASVPGFSYSAALKAKGGTWTFDALNTWLTNPRADVPGTAMTFAGLPSEKQRADVIDYLNSNSDKPLPLPAAAKAAAAPANAAANPPAAATPAASAAPPANAPALPQTNAPPAGQSATSPPAAPAGAPPPAAQNAAPAPAAPSPPAGQNAAPAPAAPSPPPAQNAAPAPAAPGSPQQ
jgi:cytochrome c